MRRSSQRLTNKSPNSQPASPSPSRHDKYRSPTHSVLQRGWGLSPPPNGPTPFVYTPQPPRQATTSHNITRAHRINNRHLIHSFHHATVAGACRIVRKKKSKKEKKCKTPRKLNPPYRAGCANVLLFGRRGVSGPVPPAFGMICKTAARVGKFMQEGTYMCALPPFPPPPHIRGVSLYVCMYVRSRCCYDDYLKGRTLRKRDLLIVTSAVPLCLVHMQSNVLLPNSVLSDPQLLR